MGLEGYELLGSRVDEVVEAGEALGDALLFGGRRQEKFLRVKILQGNKRLVTTDRFIDHKIFYKLPTNLKRKIHL